MPAYVCLLRGVNVTGYRRVDMKELKGLFASLGHTDVTTYIRNAWGNAAPGVTAAEVAKARKAK